MKTIPIEKQSLSKIKKRIKELERQVRVLESDRNIYRNYVVKNFKDQLSCIGTDKRFTCESMVRTMTEVFAKAEAFTIWW